MTSANLDLVQSIFAAWGRGDYGSAEWADDEIEFVRIDGPDPGSWKGRAAMAAATRFRLDAWDDFRMEVESYRELDEERILVLARLSGRGKTSGLELGQLRTAAAMLLHVRAGKVARMVIYMDRERAFADLGLES